MLQSVGQLYKEVFVDCVCCQNLFSAGIACVLLSCKYVSCRPTTTSLYEINSRAYIAKHTVHSSDYSELTQ